MSTKLMANFKKISIYGLFQQCIAKKVWRHFLRAIFGSSKHCRRKIRTYCDPEKIRSYEDVLLAVFTKDC